jgi:hypothetical protein
MFFFYRRSFADVTSLLQMHNSILRFADVQHPPAATRLPSNFSPPFFFVRRERDRTRDKEFSSFAVTWNLTIDDGLEVELDKMMTSFRWWPPLCPNTDSVQLHSIDSLRLLACLALLGVVQMTRHCSNLASAVHKTLCRRRLHCHASRSFSTAVAFSPRSRVACHTIFKASFLIVASFPRFDCDTSCTQFYFAACISFYRRSFADVTSLLQMHNSILRFADVQHPPAATRLPSNFSPPFFFLRERQNER